MPLGDEALEQLVGVEWQPDHHVRSCQKAVAEEALLLLLNEDAVHLQHVHGLQQQQPEARQRLEW